MKAIQKRELGHVVHGLHSQLLLHANGGGRFGGGSDGDGCGGWGNVGG